MIRLERSIRRKREIIRLFFAECRQLHADFGEMKRCDFLVEMFRQRVDLALIVAGLRPQFDLRQRLVGK